MKVQKKLKFTFLITNKEYGPKLVEYLKNKGIENYISFYGKGSANAAILEYLGIGERENDVLIYPSNSTDANLILEYIKENEYLLKNTIAFIVPVKGISSMNILNHLLKGE